jgi:hypothetical protein
MRHFQATALKNPPLAACSKQNRRAASWRTLGYLAAIAPFLLIVGLAWLRPDLNRPEALDWRPVIALADASRQEGNLYGAKHLYVRGAQLASWSEDWEGLLLAACGIRGLEQKDLNFFNTHTILVRAMMAAEGKQSRAGMAAVAKAFTELGRHEVAATVLRRIGTDWPDEAKFHFRDYSGACSAPALGAG